MFGKRRLEAAEDRAETAELKLMVAESRLAQFDDLMRKLKRHDHFRFNSAGGIIAYNKDEPAMYGTAYTVPDERFSL